MYNKTKLYYIQDRHIWRICLIDITNVISSLSPTSSKTLRHRDRKNKHTTKLFFSLILFPPVLFPNKKIKKNKKDKKDHKMWPDTTLDLDAKNVTGYQKTPRDVNTGKNHGILCNAGLEHMVAKISIVRSNRLNLT